MSIHKRTGKRGDGWQVKFPRGNGRRGSKTFRTKKEAERFDAQIRLDDGQLKVLTNKQRKVSFGEYAQMWQCSKDEEHLPRTIQRRNLILKKHVLPDLGDLPIRSIRPKNLRDLVTKWRSQGLSIATIRTHIAYVGQIFRLALDDEVIIKDPTKRLRLPKAPAGKGVILDQEQCKTLLANVGDHHRRLFYVLLVTGLRIGELFQLQVGDIERGDRKLVVRRSKTPTGEIKIDLSENDLAVLDEQIRSLGAEAENTDSILFRSVEGRPLSYRNLSQRVLKKVIRESGLPEFTFHDLRKTHATMLVAAGTDPKVVEQRMGHRTIGTTLKYYAQPTKERQVEAAHVAVRYLTTPNQAFAEAQTLDVPK